MTYEQVKYLKPKGINPHYQENLTSLPDGCIFRPARFQDTLVILKFMIAARLDPTRLYRSQFWVIESEEQLIAFGRLCNLNHAKELASLFVVPQWRHQGLGSYLVQHLIAQASQPLYLKCRADKLISFYSQFGFVPIPWQTLPMPLKWEFGLTELMKRLLHIPLITMRYLEPI
ncbi:hypothetical protein B7486_51160 [cyanobacterium TDX16]|nr:hypothetical protein B7486_51160 [cyanobacterium TDX16]